MRAVALLALAACAPGLVQEFASPYTLDARGYFDTLNDNFMGRDDLYTAGFHLRHEQPRWLVAVDYSILTEKTHRVRTDELAALVGAVGRSDSLSCRVGAGAVIDGQLGGSYVQNTVHDAIHDREVHGEYPARTYEPLVAGDVGWRYDTVEFRLFAATTRHAQVLEPCFRFGDELGCFEVGYVATRGHEQSAVARDVLESMDQFKVSCGITLGYVGVSFQHIGRTTLIALATTW